MNIFEKINSEDRDHIVDYIEAYAGFGGESIDMKESLEHILRFWNRDKVDLCRLLGGELILTKEINFAKPSRMMEDDVYTAITLGDGRTFNRTYSDFVRRPEVAEQRWNLPQLMYCDTLAANIYTGESFSIPTPDGHTIAINTGCKVSKVLGKIATAYRLEGYEEFRIAHSMCLNQKTLKGELCLSIHPLDYMTMSDNNCNWSSCMSWREGGDYRQGTVEMMNSPCVVVAYLRASDKMESVYGREWNSKKWRQLYIVTPHVITGIRQYPYKSDELNGITLKWLRELAEKNVSWGPYSDTAVLLRNTSENILASFDRTTYIDFHTHFMYNDFYSDHLSYVAESIPETYKLCFSGVSECMVCGDDLSRYDECDCEPCSLTCPECEHYFYCDECGERIDSNCTYIVDGQRVCEYCYNEHYSTCNFCEETHHENYFVSIYLRTHKDQPFNEMDYAMSICDSCINSSRFIKVFGKAETVPYGRYSERWVVDLDNLTLEALDYFDLWDSDVHKEIEAAIKARLGTDA